LWYSAHLVRRRMSCVQQIGAAGLWLHRGHHLVRSHPATTCRWCTPFNWDCAHVEVTWPNSVRDTNTKTTAGDHTVTAQTLKITGLGTLECEIMKVLWQRPSATIRHLIESLGNRHAY